MCINNGALSGGSIDAQPNPACVGDTITFTLSGVVDSGGEKRENCVEVNIPPVTPTFAWVITKPDNNTVSGAGAVATVLADLVGTYSVTFTAVAVRECPPAPRIIGPQTAATVDIASVVWEEFSAASTPLDTCPNNGGRRIFPGRRFVVDPSASIRTKVALRATVAPVVEGCTVHFRVWDVDDPFDQNNPALPNVGLIDSNTTGPDNRGADPGVGTWSGTTDVNGKARVTLDVSMQPGNNYRGGAAVEQARLTATTQAEADSNSPPQHVKFTNMLTVWRKVWLELDSMATGSDITYSGTIDEINNNTPHVGDGTVELDVPDVNDDGRFDGGSMTVPSTGSAYSIIDNVDVFGDDDYTMSTLIAAGDLNAIATVVDDDTAALPKTPNASIAVLDGKYSNAYVNFTEDIASRDSNNVFVATLPWTNPAIAGKGAENADLTPATAFWVALVVTCYQSYALGDNSSGNLSTGDADPDKRYHVHGAASSTGDTTLYFAGTPSSTENVTAVYYETLLDYTTQVAAGFWPAHLVRAITFSEPRIIAHEIGHQFGVSHPPPGSSTLMSPWTGADLAFDGGEIAVIRSSQDLSSN